MKKSNYHNLALHLAGIYVVLLSCGYYQEKIITKLYGDQRFRYYVFVSFFQSLGGALIGLFVLRRKGLASSASRDLLLEYFKCSILKLLSSQLGYRAVDYVSYPTALMAKSCKAIPFLAMNLLVYGKKYAKRKYVSSALLTAGVFFFSLKRGSSLKSTQGNRAGGILMLFLSLVFDGYLSSSQDNIFKTYGTDSFHMMLYLSVFSSLISLAISTFSREFFAATAFILEHPSVLIDLTCISLLNITGQTFIYSMLEKHGGLALAVSAVPRKILSLIFSVVIFKHRLNIHQHIGLLLVFAGLGVELVFMRNKEAQGR